MERGGLRQLATRFWRWNGNDWHFSIKTGQMYSRWDTITASAESRNWSLVWACISLFTTSVAPAQKTVRAVSTNVQNMTQPPSLLRHVLLCPSVRTAPSALAGGLTSYRATQPSPGLFLSSTMHVLAKQAITSPCMYAQIYIHKYTKNTELYKTIYHTKQNHNNFLAVSTRKCMQVSPAEQSLWTSISSLFVVPGV